MLVTILVNPSCLQFLQSEIQVLLEPNPIFIPKVNIISFTCQVIILLAFYLPLFVSQRQERSNALCPFHTLWPFVDMTMGIRKSDKLCVPWASVGQTDHETQLLTLDHRSYSLPQACTPTLLGEWPHPGLEVS